MLGIVQNFIGQVADPLMIRPIHWGCLKGKLMKSIKF